MSNVLGTSFATAGFSFDPNLSPNNQSFSYAVRAVLAAAGITWNPPITLTANTITVNGTLVVNGTSTFNSDATFKGNVVLTGTSVPLILSTNTAYAWGGGGGGIWGPTIQLGMAGGIDAENSNPTVRIWGGVYWNGTSAIYTGTGTNNVGTSTGMALVVGAGEFLAQYWGPGGTYGGTATGVNLLAVQGTVSPVIRGYGPNSAALVNMTPDFGSFTGTFHSGTNTKTCNCQWAKMGKVCLVVLDSDNADDRFTSVNANLTFSGVPAVIDPSPGQTTVKTAWFFDNGGIVDCNIFVSVGGTWNMYKGSSGSNNSWTASGTIGLANTVTIAYTCA